MFPVYGLIQPLYEPLHDATRDRLPVPARALAYGVGFLGAEYATGRILRVLLGRAPWDYSSARLQVDRLIRLDYLVLWGAFGLALEPVHDRLAGRWAPIRRGPPRRRARPPPPPPPTLFYPP